MCVGRRHGCDTVHRGPGEISEKTFSYTHIRALRNAGNLRDDDDARKRRGGDEPSGTAGNDVISSAERILSNVSRDRRFVSRPIPFPNIVLARKQSPVRRFLDFRRIRGRISRSAAPPPVTLRRARIKKCDDNNYRRTVAT